MALRQLKAPVNYDAQQSTAQHMMTLEEHETNGNT